jgi:hypothetical protein
LRLGGTADAAASADWSPADLLELDALVIVVALVVIVFVVIPLLLFGIELIIAGAVIAIGAIGRLLLGRPWTIEAASSSGQTVTWRVAGWRDSREAVDDAARTLEAGHELSDRVSTAASFGLGKEHADPRSGRRR